MSVNRIAKLIHEAGLFRVALAFLTRLPVALNQHSDKALAASVSYFPVVGWLVGVVGALGFYAGSALGSPMLAAVLGISLSVAVTGGFHEDGLADTADGFGGGWTRQRKLEIMKDSRLGSYGALALILAMLLSVSALQALDPQRALLVFCLAHGLARWTALPLLAFNDYVRADGDRPGLVEQGFSQRRLLLGTVLAWLPVVLFVGASAVGLFLVISLLLLAWQAWCRRQIGGITGDTLGAANKLTEIVVYVCLCL